MKKLLYILPLIVLFASCGEDVTGYLDELDLRQARTEYEFVQNPNLKVQPGCVIIGQLDSKITTKVDTLRADTDFEGKKGFDFVPYTVPKTAEFNYRLDDGAQLKVTLRDASGTELFALTPTNKEVKINLTAGDYKFIIENLDESAAGATKITPYFFFPDREKLGLAPNDRPKQTESYKVTDRATMISTVRCQNADMKNIQVQKMNFNNVDFTGSNFRKANLEGVVMNNVNLSKTNITQTVFTNAQMIKALMDSVIDFSYADFTKANMTDASLTNSYSRNAIFFNTTLRKTKFDNTSMTKANFFAAVMDVSSLQNANVSESEMSFVSLVQADAKGTNFCNTVRNNWRVDGLIVDSSTQCYAPIKTE